MKGFKTNTSEHFVVYDKITSHSVDNSYEFTMDLGWSNNLIPSYVNNVFHSDKEYIQVTDESISRLWIPCTSVDKWVFFCKKED